MKNERSDSDSCSGIREILDRVGDKWSLLVMGSIADGPKRYVDIRRSVSGISQRMLTLSLRLLERDGLISRTPLDTIPPSVQYELTSLGLDLVEPIRTLTKWAKIHGAEIGDAHTRYDAAKDEGKAKKRFG